MNLARRGPRSAAKCRLQGGSHKYISSQKKKKKNIAENGMTLWVWGLVYKASKSNDKYPITEKLL